MLVPGKWSHSRQRHPALIRLTRTVLILKLQRVSQRITRHRPDHVHLPGRVGHVAHDAHSLCDIVRRIGLDGRRRDPGRRLRRAFRQISRLQSRQDVTAA